MALKRVMVSGIQGEEELVELGRGAKSTKTRDVAGDGAHGFASFAWFPFAGTILMRNSKKLPVAKIISSLVSLDAFLILENGFWVKNSVPLQNDEILFQYVLHFLKTHDAAGFLDPLATR